MTRKNAVRENIVDERKAEGPMDYVAWMNFFCNKTKKILNNKPTYTQESGSEKISLPLSLINTSIYACRSAIGIISVCIRSPNFIRLLLLAKYTTIKH